MALKITCKEIHRLTSEGLDRELSMTELARIRVHLLVCHACRNFSGQMQLLRRAMRQLMPSPDDDGQGGKQ